MEPNELDARLNQLSTTILVVMGTLTAVNIRLAALTEKAAKLKPIHLPLREQLQKVGLGGFFDEVRTATLDELTEVADSLDELVTLFRDTIEHLKTEPSP
jgi:signal transduction histidine kinase